VVLVHPLGQAHPRRARERPRAIPRYAVTFAIAPSSCRRASVRSRTPAWCVFHTDSPEVARLNRAACASCHVDGRSDGLAWQIEGHPLRTPVLAGRVAGTGPYKWTGRDASLDGSIMSTDRIAWAATTARTARTSSSRAPIRIAAYLESLAPCARAHARRRVGSRRGKALFDSARARLRRLSPGRAR